jgi:hypothetical protein
MAHRRCHSTGPTDRVAPASRSALLSPAFFLTPAARIYTADFQGMNMVTLKRFERLFCLAYTYTGTLWGAVYYIFPGACNLPAVNYHNSGYRKGHFPAPKRTGVPKPATSSVEQLQVEVSA